MRRGGPGRTVRRLLTLLCVVALACVGVTQASAQQAAVRGGDLLYGDHGFACTVGYNVQGSDGSRYGLVHAGCAERATRWYLDASRTVSVGTTEGGDSGPGAFRLVRYTNDSVSYPGEVHLGGGMYVDVFGATWPQVGQEVCLGGGVTGVHCGVVSALDVSIGFPEGTVSGLFEAHLCAEGQRAGAPSVSGNRAVGLLLAGTSCVSGGRTYHVPVIDVLAAHGLQVY